MSLFVSTNIASMQASRNLFNAGNALDVAYQRLSSGFRINSAADDAAGLQISDRMTSAILSDGQVVRNLNDGISYAQIAEGGLAETTRILQRMRQLAVQAQNGVLNNADREALNKEVVQLKAEMDRIANATEAFGRYPLLGKNINNVPPIPSIGNKLANGVEAMGLPSGINSFGYIPAGSTNVTLTLDSFTQDDDLQIFTTSGRHIAGTNIGNHSWDITGVPDANAMKTKVLTSENGFEDNASYNAAGINQGGTTNYNGMTLTYSGDNDLDDSGVITSPGEIGYETLHIDVVTENLILIANGHGAFNLTASWAKLGSGNSATSSLAGDVKITATNTADTALEFIRVFDTPATSAALGLTTVDVSTAESAEASLALIDQALKNVGSYRASYGADINQMQSQLQNIQTQQENISAARSRIRDTDYAVETSQLTRTQIIKQASTSVLTQANSRPQLALQLLS